MHIDTATPDMPHKLQDILGRIALPLLMFLAVLTGILLLSYWLLLPRWTQVSVGGNLLGPDEAEAYAVELLEEVTAREHSRLLIALPLHDDTYAALRGRRAAMPDLKELREQIADAARRGSPGDTPDAVRIETVSFDAEASKLTIGGIVGGVGPRSMTVLAYFTEVVGQLPFVHEVIPPAFERREDPEIGFTSPFTLTLVLKNVSSPAQ